MNRFTTQFLKHYPETGYTLRLKARFLLYMCLALLIFLPATITSTAIISLSNPRIGYRLNMQVILTDTVGFVILLIVVYVLYRGFFSIAAHLFINFAFLIVWVIIAIDPQNSLQRLDTIAFQLALLSLIPLVIIKNKSAAVFYTALNIAALLAFVIFLGDSLGISRNEIWEYYYDNMFAMIIIGIASYNIFSIQKDALDRAMSDIAALEKKEADLQASEERYRAVVEDQTEMIVRFTPAGTITFVNNALKRFFLANQGFAGDYIGASINDFIKIRVEDVVRRYLPRFTVENPIMEMEHSFTGVGGKTCWTIWTARALYDEKGQAREFQAAGRDITEKKIAEEEKEKLEEKLRQSQKMESIGNLAGGIAHDFNNLLTAITGNIQLAIMDLDGDNAAIPLLEEADRAAANAASLTHQLLAFSRKQIIEPRIMDLNRQIEKTSKLLTRVIGENIELKILRGTPAATVNSDPIQIEQILINLAVNARDAMPDGGKLTIETADTVLDEFYCRKHADARPGPHVLLAVSDTGTGMSETVKQRLFEPFFTTKPRSKGTGMGLATIYGAVKQNKGSIEVYSVPGQGTTFKIYFPRVEGTTEQRESAPDTEELKRGIETILIVEDEPHVREFARTILTRLGYAVLAFGSAEDALAQQPEVLRAVSLLMTDVILPGINGRALSDEIKALNPGVQVLYTSGYTDNVIVHHGVLEKGIQFIGKPYTAQSLSAKVRDILDARHRS